MGDETERDGWFVRAAGAVGDLGNPFYREERAGTSGTRRRPSGSS